MAYKNLGYHALIAWPPRLLTGVASDDSTSTNLTIDATDEEVHFIGQILLPTGTASATFDTNTAIQFMLGTTTFANAGTTLRIGVQDVDATTGVPGRGDGTFDCYADYVGGTDTLTSAGWNTVTMETGSKTVSNGDLIAICFKLVSRGGTDSVAITAAATSGNTPSRPLTVSNIGAGFAARIVLPIVAINFNGTYATLAGAVTYKSRTNSTFNSSSTPDERGSLFSLPFSCSIYGVTLTHFWAAASTTIDVQIYSDPLGTPAVITGLSATVDSDTLYATNVGDVVLMFPAPVRVPANTRMALTLKSGSTTNVSIKTLNFENDTLSDICYGNGEWTYCSRSDGSGAFTETTTIKAVQQLLISDIETGPGPTLITGVM